MGRSKRVVRDSLPPKPAANGVNYRLDLALPLDELERFLARLFLRRCVTKVGVIVNTSTPMADPGRDEIAREKRLTARCRTR